MDTTKTQTPFGKAHFALLILGALCLIPGVPAFAALLAGVMIALTLGNPLIDQTRTWSHRLLTWSVMGLGAGMNIAVVATVGMHGFAYTLVGITATLTLGTLMGRWLSAERETSLLVSVGTAICGGSAIAAVAPVMRARPQAISVALATVFLLNATALVIFPPIGHYLNLNENQFGLWSALAIHDTSSVVGATLQYGREAVQIGTTVKLARALWIVPTTLLIGFLFRNAKSAEGGVGKPKAKRPWFILGFLVAAALVTWIPALQPAGKIVEHVSRQVLVLTLFLIGSNLNAQTLRAVGIRPLLLGFFLWIIVASLTLLFVIQAGPLV